MLDLNDPNDARKYVERWVEDPEDVADILRGATDADLLAFARQLFLYYDHGMEQAGHLKIQ